MVLIFAIPSGLTYTLGRMTGSQRHGWAVWAAMAFLFLAGVSMAYWAEAQGQSASGRHGPACQCICNRAETWRARKYDSASRTPTLFATVTTDASCGAVNGMHDSYTPLGGMVPLINIMLGEVVFGGVGAGLYGILVFVVLAVFIAGLMVGRTPEYLGKKIESYDVKMAMLAVLILTFTILVFSAVAVVKPYGTSSITNPGPHGLSQILYAYTSSTGNNGSAFAGLNANTMWYNTTTAVAQLLGRFFMIIPVLAIAGSLAKKKNVPESAGTFPGDRPSVRWLAGLHDFDCGRAYVLPGSESRADSRTPADAGRKGFLRCLWIRSLTIQEESRSPIAPFSRGRLSIRFASLIRAR